MPTAAKQAKRAGDGLNVAAIQKILALLKQRHDENGALIEELERLIGGGVGIGELMKQAYELWGELYPHGSYLFNFTKDAPNMKRLIRAFGPEELGARFRRYLSCREEFYVAKKHPFGLFVATVNSWADDSLPADQAAPAVGCKHVPRCSSDRVHTQRVVRENTEARS